MNMRELVPWSRERRGIRQRDDDPFSSLQREVNRLFEDFFGTPDNMTLMRRSGEFMPLVNVTESDDEIRVTAELPGIDPKEIDVRMERDLLILQGEKKEETEDERDNFYRMERSYGSFYRAIRIPAEVVNEEKIDAKFKNGVLTVRLPKRADAQRMARRIEVKSQ